MSDEESVRRRPPSPPHRRVRQRRDDDDNQRQIGVGAQGNQIIPVVNNPPPPPPPMAKGIVTIEKGNDVVSALSNLSYNCNQAIYILSGVGTVTLVRLTILPSMIQVIPTFRPMEILNLSGWFQPIVMDNGWRGAFSRPNGILHVSLSGRQNVSVANRLLACSPVVVSVAFVCGPDSLIEEPRDEPIRIPILSPLPRL